VSVKDCKVCHVWKDNKHDFELIHEDAKLCTQCHEDMDVTKKPKEGEEEKEKKKLVVHEPVGEDCVTCHVPHTSDEKGLLSMPVLEMCEACHDEVFEAAKSKDMASRHSVVLQGKACLSCHTPHVSKHKKLLTVASRPMCLNCHSKDVKHGERTIPNLTDQLAKENVHGPAEDEDCTECHTAHGSKYPTLLSRTYPTGFYAPFDPKSYELCFECHDAELATEAETDEATEFRNGPNNLHHLHVNKTVKGRSCRTCHSSHASDQPKQIRKSVPFGKMGWAIPIIFQENENGGTCNTGCHEPRRYDREKALDTAVPVATAAATKPAEESETKATEPKGDGSAEPKEAEPSEE
jgi:predicted CXXCH cytochrome family protein